MSIVKAEKAMKRITKKTAFLLWSEEDAVINDFSPIFHGRISTINGLVKKNYLHEKPPGVRQSGRSGEILRFSLDITYHRCPPICPKIQLTHNRHFHILGSPKSEFLPKITMN